MPLITCPSGVSRLKICPHRREPPAESPSLSCAKGTRGALKVSVCSSCRAEVLHKDDLNGELVVNRSEVSPPLPPRTHTLTPSTITSGSSCPPNVLVTLTASLLARFPLPVFQGGKFRHLASTLLPSATASSFPGPGRRLFLGISALAAVTVLANIPCHGG